VTLFSDVEPMHSLSTMLSTSTSPMAAFRLSQRARRKIRLNLVVSMRTVAVLVFFALWGKIPFPIGVVGHEGSTVVVVMNSLRLLFGGKAKAG